MTLVLHVGHAMERCLTAPVLFDILTYLVDFPVPLIRLSPYNVHCMFIVDLSVTLWYDYRISVYILGCGEKSLAHYLGTTIGYLSVSWGVEKNL